jgi:hypothetical protein
MWLSQIFTYPGFPAWYQQFYTFYSELSCNANRITEHIAHQLDLVHPGMLALKTSGSDKFTQFPYYLASLLLIVPH